MQFETGTMTGRINTQNLAMITIQRLLLYFAPSTIFRHLELRLLKLFCLFFLKGFFNIFLFKLNDLFFT